MTEQHGTPAGHRAGCKGRALCPNRGTELPTCLDAAIRYQGDYTYHQRVEQGYSPEEIHLLEQADAQRLAHALAAEKAREAPKPTPKPKAVRVFGERVGTRWPIVHGRAQGYKRGCRTAEDCPATPTCLAAARALWVQRGIKWRESQRAKA